MGYSHYYYQRGEVPTVTWSVIQHQISTLIAGYNQEAGYRRVVEEFNLPNNPPVINADVIRFNGADDNGYETFVLSRVPYRSQWDEDKEGVFNAIKTACRPYDVVVMACILLMRHLSPYYFRFSSDGDQKDWEPARALLAEHVGIVFADSYWNKLWEERKIFQANHGAGPTDPEDLSPTLGGR